jgi:nitrous oxide reductase accessory protein NosL
MTGVRAGGPMRTALSYFLILFLAAVSFAGDDNDRTNVRKGKCPVCGMFISMFADWNAKIVFADSTHAAFDGSKDLFKYYLNMKRYNPAQSQATVTAITVKDYYTKKDIDARKAFYAIWGDVYGPMGHEPIPFEKEVDAKRFLQEHLGKKIVKFKDITLKLLHSLDNPA